MRFPYRAALLVAAAAFAAGAAVGPVLADGWRGPGGPDGMRLLDQFDLNKDGKLTQEEIDTARKDQLAKYDKNGDGQLSLEEYQLLWVDVMRPMMVRQFQANDADGDAQVTVVEFQERFADLVRDRDRNGDGVLTADELRPGRHGPGPRGPGRGPGPHGDD